MKYVWPIFLLLAIGCDKRSPSVPNEPEVIIRPIGNVDWYSGGCVNFATSKKTKVDYAMPNNELISYGFRIEEKFMGSVYIGPDTSIDGRIERKGRINNIEFDYYRDNHENHIYIFYTGFHPNAYGGEFFELMIVNGYESEMATVLSSIRSGSSEGFPLDYVSPGTITAVPIPKELESFISTCNLRHDLSREYREGFDWIAFLRNRWYDIGADWIPLEGESKYPKVPDHLKR